VYQNVIDGMQQEEDADIEHDDGDNCDKRNCARCFCQCKDLGCPSHLTDSDYGEDWDGPKLDDIEEWKDKIEEGENEDLEEAKKQPGYISFERGFDELPENLGR
jgi:hypothetical protein